MEQEYCSKCGKQAESFFGKYSVIVNEQETGDLEPHIICYSCYKEYRIKYNIPVSGNVLEE